MSNFRFKQPCVQGGQEKKARHQSKCNRDYERLPEELEGNQ